MKRWDEVKLRDVSQKIQYGYTASAEDVDTGIKFVRITDIAQDYVDWVNVPYCKISESDKAKYALESNDIVIARTGATVGYAKQMRNIPTDAVFASYLIRVKIKNEMSKRFVGLLVESLIYKDYIKTIAGGAAQPNANAQDLTSFPFFLPPLPIQKKIAAILSAYDDLIENNNRRILTLEKMAEELYREWFVRLRFPGHEEVKIVKGVPEGWELKNLNEVSKNFDGQRIPLSSMEREKMRGIIPYYGAAKIIDYINKYIFDGKYLLIAEDGSVITDNGYPVLQFVNEKFWVNNHTHILQGLDEVYSTEWLYLSLMRFPIAGLITGAAQPKITQANLNKILVLTPPKAILVDFNSLTKPIIDFRTRIALTTNILRNSRDRLLSRLISGKIDVENMDIEFPASMKEELVHA